MMETKHIQAGQRGNQIGAKMDILGSVPQELSEIILQYLTPKELSACSRVSKKWREMSRYNRLWKSHCRDLDLLDYLPPGDGSGTSWKQLYAEFVLNWRRGRYSRYSLPREQGGGPRTVEVQGDLLVMHGLNKHPVYLYRLHPCGPLRIGHIDSAPYSYFCLRTFNDSYIAVKADSGTKVYEITKTACGFHSAYHFRGGNLIVYKNSQESEFNDNLSQDFSSYTYLDGTYIYFQFSEGHRIHAVNLETLCHTSTEELPNFRLLIDLSPSSGIVFLFNRETKDIRVLDRSLSEEIMVLHTDPAVYHASKLITSDSYIVGLFLCQGGDRLLRVWDKFHGNEVLSKRFYRTEVQVHDVVISRDQLFISALESPITSNRGLYLLSSFSITSGRNLGKRDLPRWDTHFSISNVIRYCSSLRFIKPQFLAVTVGNSRNWYILVFDSISGKKLNELSSNDEATCLSSKYIVNKTNEGFQICSFIPNKFQQESGELVGGEEAGPEETSLEAATFRSEPGPSGEGLPLSPSKK